MSQLLAGYLGSKVEVHYSWGGGFTDSGQIVRFDEQWVELDRADGEPLLIPISAIRIIKVKRRASSTPEENRLLRPAGSEEPAVTSERSSS